MSKEEIKPSLSLKYFLLLILTAIISDAGTYLWTVIFYESPSYDVSLSEYFSGNLVELDPQVKAENDSKFRLKNNPDVDLKAFYKYKATITSVDDEGIEELKITFSSNKNAILIKSTITSNPNALMQQIDFVLIPKKDLSLIIFRLARFVELRSYTT